MQMIQPPQDRMAQLLNQQRASYMGFNSLSILEGTDYAKQHRFDFRSPTKQELEEMLDTDTTFRWLHIPFVMAELVWDRLDTINNVCRLIHLEHGRKLNRQINEIHRDFNSKKRCLIEGDCHNAQVEHGEAMIDEMEKDIASYYQLIYKAVGEKFPELNNDERMFVSAIHEARMLYAAIKVYNEKFRNILKRDFGLTTKDIMPADFWKLDAIVIQFMPKQTLPLYTGVMKECINKMVQLIFDIRLFTDKNELQRTINI